MSVVGRPAPRIVRRCARQTARRTRRNLIADGALAVATGATLLIVLAILVVILFDVIAQRHAAPVAGRSSREPPRDGMTAGGIFPAIVGMVEMVMLMTLAGVPVGVATAIYLHEYASPVSPVTRADPRSPSPTSPACRPSCSACSASASSSSSSGAGIDKAFFGGEKVFGQPALLWAALTHGRADAAGRDRRDRGGAARGAARAARGVAGAGRDQVPDRVQRRRAPGELRHPDRHDPGGQPRRRRGGADPVHRRRLLPARACPVACRRSSWSSSYHVYVLSTQSPDVDATKPILYATVLVLLALTFTLNLAAVVVRARHAARVRRRRRDDRPARQTNRHRRS